MQSKHTITRISIWIAILISAFFAIILPVGYFALSYQNMLGSLDTEIGIAAETISKGISRNPRMWKYEQVRYEEVLSNRLHQNYAKTLRILDESGETIARVVLGKTESPVISRTFNLLDSGLVVGKIQVRASLRPLLIRTVLVAFLGMTVGLGVFVTLRVLPLRAIYAAEESLRQNRDSLAERTAELTLTNAALTKEITARRVAEKQLLHNALHDVLTTLPNRALFIDRLTHAMAMAKRHPDYKYAVLFMDLDRFKIVNDSFGHVVGDQLLIAFGHRLMDCIRPGDTAARLGGDEYALLLENIRDLDNARVMADRIVHKMSEPFNLSDHEVFVTASIGIALCEDSCENTDQILRDADTAMYQAKSTGGATYVVFEPGMYAHAYERMRLENELRKAVEREEFLVYYQPIFSLTNSELVGYEALVRWEHPERGLIGPGDFIQAAEETGVIVLIDRFVLRRACNQLQEWQGQLPHAPLPFMSVNISNKQFAQADFIEYLAQIIQETKIDPGHLKLEITENVIIENPAGTAAILNRLKTLGVKLYIDDFGTGYSALNYLQYLPIDGLKIDRSFIRDMGSQEDKNKIIDTIIMLAKNMNIDAIAEGVETSAQLAHMQSLNCRYGQGFLFSRPVTSDHARAFMENTRTKPAENPA